MKIITLPRFIKKYRLLLKLNPNLTKTIKAELELFSSNKYHPSLRLHQLHDDLGNLYSITVTNEIRIILQPVNGGIILHDIGTHNQVY